MKASLRSAFTRQAWPFGPRAGRFAAGSFLLVLLPLLTIPATHSQKGLWRDRCLQVLLARERLASLAFHFANCGPSGRARAAASRPPSSPLPPLSFSPSSPATFLLRSHNRLLLMMGTDSAHALWSKMIALSFTSLVLDDDALSPIHPCSSAPLLLVSNLLFTHQDRFPE